MLYLAHLPSHPRHAHYDRFFDYIRTLQHKKPDDHSPDSISVYCDTPLADFSLYRLDQRELLLYSGLNREVFFSKRFGDGLTGDFAVGYVDAAL